MPLIVEERLRMDVPLPQTTRVLIVESVPELAEVWQRHLVRQGMQVTVSTGKKQRLRICLRTRLISSFWIW